MDEILEDFKLNEDIVEKLKAKKMQSSVDHPQHYQSKCGLEAIDVIEAFDLNFNLGNVIKYVLRAENKDNYLENLEKASWYLSREIYNYENNYG